MSKKDKTNPEIYDIMYEKKFLYLICPKCKNIPYLSFNLKNTEQISIKCDKCHNSSEMNLNNYLKGLSSKNEFESKKCENHTNFLDKYCYNCHIQFCSKCEESKIHESHKIKKIIKRFNSEKIKNAKETIESLKNYFKNYIRSFMNEYITKIPKSKHFHINNNLLKPYIEDMKTFFQACDCILLNYDVEYPDYYQQINLKNLLYILNEKTTLKDLNEPKLERLFKYSNNNFINNNKNVGDNLIIVSSLNDFKGKVIKSLIIDDELILIIFRDCLKLYNYKNKTCISKLEIDLSADEIKLNKINKDNIGLILFNDKNYISKLEMYSISSNKIIFEKNFEFYIQNIKNINNNSFGIIKDHSLEIYALIENSNSLELQMITNIKIPYLNDFIHLSNEKYIIALNFNSIIVYDKNYNIIKTVEHEKEFKTIYETKDRHIILGGRIIGLLNINDWSISILFDDNIDKLKMSYLSGVETYIEYSHFNITYFNRLICKQKFKQILKCHYDNVDDEVIANENNVCIFDFNPENDKMTKNHVNKNLKPEKIYINEDDELISVKDSCINVYELK